MMQVQFLQSLPDYSSIDSPFDEIGIYFADRDAQVGSFEFSSSSMSTEDFSNVSSSVLFSTPFYADDDSQNFPNYGEESPVMFPMEQCFPSLEEVDTPLSDQFMVDELQDLCEWVASDSGVSSQQICAEQDTTSLILSPVSSEQSIDISSVQTSLVFPSEDMEVDYQLSLFHLLKAYGDAMELEQKDLANEIARRLKEKSCPIGATLERVAYYLIQALKKQVDYLSQESSKNYGAAFRAFYQIFPYGRFAHFTANSVILEAIPEDAGIVHIVDFDIGKGVQWPPLIEALGRRGKSLVQLTSIKWEEEDSSCIPPKQSFEETKKKLDEQARISGVRLQVEEIDMGSLVSEMKKTKKRGGRNEWLVFNCMAGLPHMGRVRNIRHVIEFLKVAKYSVNYPIKEFSGTCKGIITVGNVSGEQKLMDCSEFGSFFEGRLIQLQTFFESIEKNFPCHLREARTVIECLFMAPQVSSLAGFKKWEETTREGRALSEIGLKAWRLSPDTILEAKELVREGESPFWVRTERENENQMILGYMGTALVEVSSWIL
ncbi:nodulation-signaling pathway 2 protein-like [Melia azedarach]|uniref:Nodulation-signaling pathway 2 protein-like n=1 Tax=Melia azedarach TaxID=155640 RepID=A0ACC1YP13_MELAZ|nr:nodulation-signaling pathway 2 protein-like [Melia azedarach]